MRRSNDRASMGGNDEDLKRKISWSAVKRLLQLAIPYRKILSISAVLMLFSTAIQLSVPILVRGTVDKVSSTGSVSTLDSEVLLLLGLIVFGGLLGYVQYIISAFAGNRIVTEVRLKLFAHLQRLPVAYFDKTRSGDLTSYLSNDVSLLQTTLTDDLVKFGGQLITLFGGIVVAVTMNWRLSLVVVSLLVLMMCFFVFFGRALRQLTRKGLDALSNAMGSMTEAIANIRLVKAFAREQYEDERATFRLGEVFRLGMKSSRWEGMMGTVAGTGFMLMIIGVGWYGGRGVISGTMKMGDLFGFITAIFIISGPMAQIASLYTRLQRAVGAGERIFSILDTSPEQPDVPNATDFPIGTGAVEFVDIKFGYVADVPVMRSLNLTIKAGKVTAIVGPSGAGKSTLASLLYRFYEPQAGQILIDGVPITNIRREALREHVGIVPQEPILFNGTLRDNIRYGKLTATDQEVEQAARDANVEEFVKGFPQGYETMVGERGITLSGGQRQRVAIARAMLKDPKILILDEATSALDNISEALVKEALDRLMKGRTTLVIAHRLSTIQDADQIAVLAEGRIAELGTHAELLGKSGKYAELYELAAI